jgi:hypothetical protein
MPLVGRPHARSASILIQQQFVSGNRGPSKFRRASWPAGALRSRSRLLVKRRGQVGVGWAKLEGRRCSWHLPFRPALDTKAGAIGCRVRPFPKQKPRQQHHHCGARFHYIQTRTLPNRRRARAIRWAASTTPNTVAALSITLEIRGTRRSMGMKSDDVGESLLADSHQHANGFTLMREDRFILTYS